MPYGAVLNVGQRARSLLGKSCQYVIGVRVDYILAIFVDDVVYVFVGDVVHVLLLVKDSGNLVGVDTSESISWLMTSGPDLSHDHSHWLRR